MDKAVNCINQQQGGVCWRDRRAVRNEKVRKPP